MEEASREVILCPYCGEAVEVFVELDVLGEMVYDCEVCCHPWRLTVSREGVARRIQATTLDE